MENISEDEERWAFVDYEEAQAEEEEDEALSLCDLPLTRCDESTKQKAEEEEEDVTHINGSEEDEFDFCSLISAESEMCAADEVFYQGQILPLRRSIKTRDFSHSSGGLISSRSSSHHSSSSSSAATQPKPPPPNPSRRRMPRSTDAKKSSAWNIFRLGLVAAPPEISFHDLKTRRPGNNININPLGEKKTMTIKKRDFLSGCKLCAVDTVVPSKVVIIKRRASDGEREAPETQFPAPKKRSSHRRTSSEWLKQLKRGAAPDQH